MATLTPLRDLLLALLVLVGLDQLDLLVVLARAHHTHISVFYTVTYILVYPLYRNSAAVIVGAIVADIIRGETAADLVIVPRRCEDDVGHLS